MIFVFIGCNGNRSGSVEQKEINRNDDVNSQTEGQNQEIVDDGIVPERIYATNTALPLGKFNVTNIIDGDVSTIWKTPLGAGTDEGIMFYFDEPVEIGSVKLTMAKGGEFIDVEDVTVYGNGKILKDKNTQDDMFDVGDNVSSLYIRLGERADKKEVEQNESGDEYEHSFSQEYYPVDKCVGISEVEFFQKDGTHINIVSPRKINCSVSASSVLDLKQAYSPVNLIDGKTEFGWAEGNAGSGVAEWVQFSFEENVSITKFKLWNGYQRSESHYLNNTRAHEISLVGSNGKVQRFSLPDKQEPHTFVLDEPLSGKEFKLKIEGVYPGKKYTDLVLSEIVFYGNGKPIFPFNLFDEGKVKAVNDIQSKQLQSVIDRLVKAKSVGSDMDMEERMAHSLIIRSNNSFVYYGDSYSGDYYESENLKSTIAEGGWEFIEASGNSARIRIFGKMYESSYENILYKGESERVATNIFQDFLTITDSSIVGENFIEKIDLLW